MDDPEQGMPYYTRPMYRGVTGGFGGLLAATGFYVALFAPAPGAMQVGLGLLLVLLGGNMVLAACRARESWLSRLGPLP